MFVAIGFKNLTEQNELNGKASEAINGEATAPNKILALDLLRKSMWQWHPITGEYPRLIREILYKLNCSGNGRLAAQLEKKFKDIDDRSTNIAAMVADFESPKLLRHDLKSEETTVFVIEPPKNTESYKPLSPDKWLEVVKKDKEQLKLLDSTNE